MTMPLHPSAAPPSITPADSPSAPAQYAAVTPHGQGTAPYDVQAPQADLSATFSAATDAVAPRQSATEALLSSPQGAGAFSITSGASGGGGEDWPSDISPGG